VSSTTSSLSPRQDIFWWNGGLMEIKARAQDTGNALGVLERRFLEKGYGPPLPAARTKSSTCSRGRSASAGETTSSSPVPAAGSGSRGAYRTPSGGVRGRACARHLHARRRRAHVRGRWRAGRRVGRTAPAAARPGGRDRLGKAVRRRDRRTAGRVSRWRRSRLPRTLAFPVSSVSGVSLVWPGAREGCDRWTSGRGWRSASRSTGAICGRSPTE
jgi:hypothetical protein